MDDILKALTELDKAIENGPQDWNSLESLRKNLLLRVMAIEAKQAQSTSYAAIH